MKEISIMYETARVIVEIASVIMCIILVKFMIKPYQFTREARYVGLPLGFSFLGISYALSAIAFTEPDYFFRELLWLQLLTRTFAFVFLSITYYFSKSPSKNSRLLWDITLSFVIVALVALCLLLIIAPQFALRGYTNTQVYVRVFNIICLSYIVIHTLRSHVKEPDPTTIWIPLGFILLAISQYSLLFWLIDASLAAFIGALALRLVALAVFLFVSYLTFHMLRKGDDK
jgi:hypothetical protein